MIYDLSLPRVTQIAIFVRGLQTIRTNRMCVFVERDLFMVRNLWLVWL